MQQSTPARGVGDIEDDNNWMSIINQDHIGKAIRPKEWGPACWKFLDCLVFSYPLVPSAEHQADMCDYFQALKKVLPCYSCRVDFTKMLDEDPIERHLHSRESLARWLHDKHNRVNMKLGTPTLSFENYVTKFTQQPASRDTVIDMQLKREHALGGNVAQATRAVQAGRPVNESMSTVLLFIILAVAALGAVGTISYFSKRKK